MWDLINAFDHTPIGGAPLTLWLALLGMVAFGASLRWNWIGALASIFGGLVLIVGTGAWMLHATVHPATPPPPGDNLEPLAALLIVSIATMSVFVGGAFMMLGAALGLILRTVVRARRRPAEARTPRRSV